MAHPHIFRLQCVNLYAADPRRRIGRRRHVVRPPQSLDLNLLRFYFWRYLKSFAHERPKVTLEDLTARIIVISTCIMSTPDLFEYIDNPSSVGVGCALTYEHRIIPVVVAAFLTLSCDALFVL
ncbi:hypothetical protein TNCV_376961 [Trichonephila clavipes]|nr:hypothetical protein TNCV_376961 [Trichonephila clavipes]